MSEKAAQAVSIVFAAASIGIMTYLKNAVNVGSSIENVSAVKDLGKRPSKQARV
jgi:hypothetical protein